MSEPNPRDFPHILQDNRAAILPTLMLFSAGLASGVSSLFTLYFARMYDVFALGEASSFVVHPSAERNTQIPDPEQAASGGQDSASPDEDREQGTS